MAAPTATARGTPTGIKLCDGFPTKVTFARFPTVSFWERTVTPPGIEGGDPIDLTTMHNIDWRTKCPRSLMEATNCSITAAYDPVAYNTIVQMINIKDTITVTFPDGGTLAAFGWLQSFMPQELSEGENPECNLEIVFSQVDASYVEQSFTLTAVAGT